MIVALTAVPADRTVETYVDHEPHCPTASWELVHGAVHAAKEIGQQMRVGPIVSSDVFYNPDSGQYERWSKRGVLAVEMEAAVLFTLGALRNVDAGALLTVSDVVVEGEFQRITDDDLRAAVDRMTQVALATATADSEIAAVFLVNPASDNGATGRRWPQLANAAAARGLTGDALFSERAGHLTDLAREAVDGGAELLVVVGGDGSVNEVANGIAQRDVEIAVIARGTGWDFARSQGSRAAPRTPSTSR